MHVFGGAERAGRSNPLARAGKRLDGLSLRTRRDTMAIVLVAAGALSLANFAFGVYEVVQVEDTYNAQYLPGAVPQARQTYTRQVEQVTGTARWQGAGEAGLLAVSGVILYNLLPRRAYEHPTPGMRSSDEL